MGVPGLWDVLQEAGHTHALLKYAIEQGFENNTSEIRGLRVGIDASIWFFHAENSTDAGSNPELRLLAFRCFKLLDAGVVPLFVFDGPERPDVKRGSKKGKRGSHWIRKDFITMLECFGMEWRTAPGEAEAELAYLNRIDVIDAVITDDVDTFLFGGRTVIRNMSYSLTGNKKNPAQNENGTNSKFHVRIFEADAIESNPNVELKRGGMILFALLCGGDYDNNKGIRNLSPKVAHALARLGFGDRLLAAYHRGPAHFKAFLPGWRQELTEEIRTNRSGRLPGRKDITIPQNFPDLNIFELYANPLTSARVSMNGSDGIRMRDRGNPSLPRLAEFCESKFDDWPGGGQKGILKRFSSLFYKGLVKHLLRRAALEADDKEKSKRIARGDNSKITGPLRPSPEDAVGMPNTLVTSYLASAMVDRAAAAFVNRAAPAAPTPASNAPPLFTKINKSRKSVETDGLLEYELVINPAQFVELVLAGFKGKAPALPASQPPRPSGSKTLAEKAATFDPTEDVKFWVPETMLLQVYPQFVAEFEIEAAKPKLRAPRKAGKGKQAAKKTAGDEDDVDEPDLTSSPLRPGARQGKAKGGGSPSKRQAAFSPVRPPLTKPQAQPAPSQPAPTALQPSGSSSQPTRQPPPAPTVLRTPPREPKVKQERVARQERGSTPARPGPPLVYPPASHAHLPHRAAQPPPPAPLPPHFPPPLREFVNVGLIETEEPFSDRAFIFTFTNPDDPDYVVMEDEERLDYIDLEQGVQDDIPRWNVPVVKPEPVSVPAMEHRNVAGPSLGNHAQSPMKLSRNTAARLPPESVEEPCEQVPGPSQPRYEQAVPAPTPAPVPLPRPPMAQTQIESAAPTRSNPPVRRKPPPPRAEPMDDLDGPAAGPSGLGHLNDMFDQILGIIPGAQKRKRMTAAQRKRAIAEAQAQAGTPPDLPDSQPAKRRRIANSAAATPEIQLPSTRDEPPPSTSRAPPAALQTPTGAQRPMRPTPMSSSQPIASGSRSVALFPDIPRLDFPSSSQPSRPTSRSRPVHRLNEVVVVSSDDDEDMSFAPSMQRNPPSMAVRTNSSVRRPPSIRPQGGSSQGPQKDFLADIERFMDLS